MNALIPDDALATFKREISRLIGVDLEAYHDRQVERRIQALMSRAGAADPSAYLAVLRSEPARLREFSLGITIHVSEWFRNPERFEVLARHILPELLAVFGRVRVWSAGCAIGAELYSVMMVADRLGVLDRCDFLGTDVDDGVLAQAQEGVFAPGDRKGLSRASASRYFDSLDDGRLRLRPEFARKARFERHNLLADPFGVGFHLILCRNVIIHFAKASKAKVHRDFARSLEPGGILFVGSAERVFNPDDAGLHQVRPFFYRKRW